MVDTGGEELLKPKQVEVVTPGRDAALHGEGETSEQEVLPEGGGRESEAAVADDKKEKTGEEPREERVNEEVGIGESEKAIRKRLEEFFRNLGIMEFKAFSFGEGDLEGLMGGITSWAKAQGIELGALLESGDLRALAERILKEDDESVRKLVDLMSGTKKEATEEERKMGAARMAGWLGGLSEERINQQEAEQMISGFMEMMQLSNAEEVGRVRKLLERGKSTVGNHKSFLLSLFCMLLVYGFRDTE